jgi:Fuc2NAc and GlcNAc transferase
VGGINIFWLLPLALLVAAGKIDGMLALLIGYLPLAFLALRFKAGVLESRAA